MRVCYAKFCLIAMAISLPPSAWAAARIHLREQVKLNHSDVTLNDVADLSCSDLNTLLRLRSIQLGRMSQRNADISLEREEIMRWAIQKIGRAAADADWGGAIQTKIHVKGEISKGNFEAVTRDSWVTLKVRSGLVSVESKAIALQSGAVGQYIRVKKMNVTSSLLAQIVDNNVVEIAE